MKTQATSKIIVFCPNWVGDAVMATPTLRALHKRYAHAEMLALARPSVAEVLEGNPWLDRILTYDPRSPNQKLRTATTVEKLRSENLDLAVLLTNSLRTAMLAWRTHIPRRVGYARDGRSLILTDALPLGRHGGSDVPRPVIDYYLQLAYYLGCESESYQMELATSHQDEQRADTVWRRKGLAEAEAVVVFNPGGAFGTAKHWPTEHFSELARRLVDQLPVAVLVLCGPAEEAAASAIAKGARHRRVVSLAGESLGLGLTKACVRRAGLMVTTDSGPRHFAGAFGVPVVTLFGPTHIAWSETHVPQAVHLQKDVECGPCQQRICPYEHHKCMRELSVDTVFRAAVERLSRERGLAVQTREASHNPYVDSPVPAFTAKHVRDSARVRTFFS